MIENDQDENEGKNSQKINKGRVEYEEDFYRNMHINHLNEGFFPLSGWARSILPTTVMSFAEKMANKVEAWVSHNPVTINSDILETHYDDNEYRKKNSFVEEFNSTRRYNVQNSLLTSPLVHKNNTLPKEVTHIPRSISDLYLKSNKNEESCRILMKKSTRKSINSFKMDTYNNINKNDSLRLLQNTNLSLPTNSFHSKDHVVPTTEYNNFYHNNTSSNSIPFTPISRTLKRNNSLSFSNSKNSGVKNNDATKQLKNSDEGKALNVFKRSNLSNPSPWGKVYDARVTNKYDILDTPSSMSSSVTPIGVNKTPYFNLFTLNTTAKSTESNTTSRNFTKHKSKQKKPRTKGPLLPTSNRGKVTKTELASRYYQSPFKLNASAASRIRRATEQLPETFSKALILSSKYTEKDSLKNNQNFQQNTKLENLEPSGLHGKFSSKISDSQALDILLATLIKESDHTDFPSWEAIQKRRKERADAIKQLRSQPLKKEIVKPLSPTELELVIEKMHTRPIGTTVSEKFNIPISVRDLNTLDGRQWLNDNIIDFYLALVTERAKNTYSLEEKQTSVLDTSKNNTGKNSNINDILRSFCFSTHFYTTLSKRGYKGVERWAKRKKLAILNVDYVFVPVNLNNSHWCMSAINMKLKRFEYYDSLGGRPPHNLFNLLRDYVIQESLKMDSSLSVESFDTWEEYVSENSPLQTNGSDCGVFACKTAEVLSRSGTLTFSQKDMKFIRQRMAYDILRQRLST